MTALKSHALIVQAGLVPPVMVPGHTFRILADSSATDGRFSMTEAVSPAGAFVGRHIHDDAVECFYVLEGQYDFNVSGNKQLVGPGSFALIPRGAPHEWQVAGQAKARTIVMFLPAGFESLFRLMPRIFALPGEPGGPVWDEENLKVGTRVLNPELPMPDGPAPIILPRPASDRSDQSCVRTLADVEQTTVDLRISHRSDPTALESAESDETVIGAWIIKGHYRVELPHERVNLSARDYVQLPAGMPARIYPTTPGSSALILSKERS
ncbi:MAG TPA: cupin domain-containing protein [Galbitalea sp.]|nr:cupin domain-containing protein [Galbitalea sp.]